MARATVLGRLAWRLGEVVEAAAETNRTRSLVLTVPGWPGHLAGQHIDLRLTAEDGYQAQRSYSIASAPEDPRLRITVERLPDGEVSPFLVDEVRVGDRLELRGPIGGYFTWQVAQGGPLLLVAGGSGIVPLLAMLRHRASAGGTIPARLLYSSRAYDEIIYREELDRLGVRDSVLDVTHTLTRAQPSGWTGYARRIDRTMLEEVVWPPEERPQIFICGPTGLVESVASACQDLGYEPGRIKTERFGPTGGRS
ncbi:MAG TPA: ferredoxin reductase [Dehalococcoidia bacterium]|nr:ferredoxin reductase [Dehalococcoidia bacterium]